MIKSTISTRAMFKSANCFCHYQRVGNRFRFGRTSQASQPQTRPCWNSKAKPACFRDFGCRNGSKKTTANHRHLFSYMSHIFWVNYNNSLTWIKAIWGWFPLLTMIPVRSQWGRYNLLRYMSQMSISKTFRNRVFHYFFRLFKKKQVAMESMAQKRSSQSTLHGKLRRLDGQEAADVPILKRILGVIP